VLSIVLETRFSRLVYVYTPKLSLGFKWANTRGPSDERDIHAGAVKWQGAQIDRVSGALRLGHEFGQEEGIDEASSRG